MAHKWVYLFNEVKDAEAYVGGDWEDVRGLLGGKGANLADMARIGVPVPPGFTVTTEACNYYSANGEFPEGLWDQMMSALAEVEKQAGKKFGDPTNPLLVSCRSGAKFSMPGMMDTVLNIGLNDETAAGMVELTGNERFVYDSYRRLVQMFGSVVLEIPDEAFEGPMDEFKSSKGYKLDTEMSAADYVIAMTSVCDTDEGFERLISALKAIDKRIEKAENSKNLNILSLPQKACEPFECSDKSGKVLDITDCNGKISLEDVFAYPPGIPLIVSGEIVTDDIINQVKTLADNNISQAVFSYEYAKELSDFAYKDDVTVKIHIKLDTGMSRIGFMYQNIQRDKYSLNQNINQSACKTSCGVANQQCEKCLEK